MQRAYNICVSRVIIDTKVVACLDMEPEIKSASILVVDDDIGPRESLRMVLKDNYNVFTAADVYEADEKLRTIRPDVIFLDIMMPNTNGLDFLKQIQSLGPPIPIVMITAFPSLQSSIIAFKSGAFDYIIKPFESSQIHAVAKRALSHRYKLLSKERLEDNLVYNLRKTDDENFCLAIENLLLATDAKDSFTLGHSKRVAQLFTFVARELDVKVPSIDCLRHGVFPHDVGNIGVSSQLLMKPGPLTKEEFCAIRLHPEISYSILEPIPFLKKILPGVRHHHERYDGKGYPDGLKGDEIPYEAALLAVIDTYDSLVMERPYRKRYSHQEALEIIKHETGKRFVPGLTEKVINAIDIHYRLFKKSEQAVNPQMNHENVTTLK